MSTYRYYRKAFFPHLERFCQQHRLLGSKRRVLVAVSGGVDSVVLIHFACWLMKRGELNSVRIAHMRHGVTREGAREDAQFVSELGRTLGVAVYQRYLRPNGFSEDQLRQSRLGWLNELRLRGEVIWTGHQLDDSFEWHLMQKARSSRPSLGIAVRSGAFRRPLLCVSRNHIVRFGYSLGVKWREDPTNNESKYTRNWLRHQLTHRLLERYPKALKHYAQWANREALRRLETEFSASERAIQRSWWANGKLTASMLEGAVRTLQQSNSASLPLKEIEKLACKANQGHGRGGPHLFSNDVMARIDHGVCVVLSGNEDRHLQLFEKHVNFFYSGVDATVGDAHLRAWNFIELHTELHRRLELVGHQLLWPFWMRLARPNRDLQVGPVFSEGAWEHSVPISSVGRLLRWLKARPGRMIKASFVLDELMPS